MKTITQAVLLILICGFASINAQVENLIVETYYISDSNDATDTLGGSLPLGSITYRIYLDLAEGNKLKAIYGNPNHPLVISSSSEFFNNTLRGQTFGYKINKNNLDNNTIPLDTWLTMGHASTIHAGVLKTADPDTSIVGGENNDGGTAEIPGGLLANDDPAAGIPITAADGLVQTNGSTEGFFSYGILNENNEDSTIFGSLHSDTIFTGYACRLFNINGIQGTTADNVILVAQLTTLGRISFELNIEVEKMDGSVINYVAVEKNISADTLYSNWLKYPFSCGCTDPYYAEFDPKASCDDGSCLTPIIYGCMDSSACNFNPDANWHIPDLCCFDSRCALDMDIACPGTVYGCTDPKAVNYNPEATVTSAYDVCFYPEDCGCMDNHYMEYDPLAKYDDGTYCKVLKIKGCMDFAACNYNPFANIADDMNCVYNCVEPNGNAAIQQAELVGRGISLNVLLYPNPAKELLSVEINSSRANQMVTFMVIDTYGKYVFQKKSLAVAGTYLEQLDLSEVPNGIYQLRIFTNEEFMSKSFIKE
jgi:hypothetical protein